MEPPTPREREDGEAEEVGEETGAAEAEQSDSEDEASNACGVFLVPSCRATPPSMSAEEKESAEREENPYSAAGPVPLLLLHQGANWASALPARLR